MFGLSGRQLFFLLVFVAILFAATQYGPGYYAAFQFNDFIRQEVKFAVSTKKTAEVIRGDIVQRGSELGIPVEKRDIRITSRGPSFTLDLEYHWPVDMRLYKHDLVFHVSESGEIFADAPH